MSVASSDLAAQVRAKSYLSVLMPPQLLAKMKRPLLCAGLLRAGLTVKPSTPKLLPSVKGPCSTQVLPSLPQDAASALSGNQLTARGDSGLVSV